jgi:dipeptidyl aminopeptidase/acylaminoacyl peptidase
LYRRLDQLTLEELNMLQKTKWLFLPLVLAFILSGCTATPTVVTPLPIETPPATATEAAAPTATSTPLPAVATPVDVGVAHRVAFVQEGNVWLGQAGTEAVPLTQDGGVEQVQISDDGTIVAFSRGGELWAVDADSSNERRLVSAELLAQIGPAGEAAELYRFDWLPATHTLLFNTQQVQEIGYTLNDDLHQVDAESGAYQPLLPPGQGGEFYPSPDGTEIALVRPDAISLVNADGSDYRAGLVTYEPVITYSEFRYYPMAEWAADSSAFAVAVPPADPFAQPPGETTLWRIPADGEGAQVAGSLLSNSFQHAFAFSPDLRTIAYPLPIPQAEGTQPASSPELAVVDLQTGEELVRFPEVTQIYDWSPDGRYLAFLRGAERPQAEIAELDGDSWPVDTMADASIDVQWVAPSQYLFLRKIGEAWELVLSAVDGENQVLAAIAGMPPVFDSNR